MVRVLVNPEAFRINLAFEVLGAFHKKRTTASGGHRLEALGLSLVELWNGENKYLTVAHALHMAMGSEHIFN